MPTCPVCHSEFDLGANHQRFCSEKCRDRDYRRRESAKKNPSGIRRCKLCAVPITIYNAKYCPACKKIAYADIVRRSNAAKRERDAILLVSELPTIPVLCKCPKCGEKHIVMHFQEPKMMPRIYCPRHERLRESYMDVYF